VQERYCDELKEIKVNVCVREMVIVKSSSREIEEFIVALKYR